MSILSVSFDFCIDSGDSSTCTTEKSDFVDGTYVSLENKTISGIASGLEVSGYGTAHWIIPDDDGKPV